MTLLLNSDDIEPLLTPQLVLDALEEVLADLDRGHAANMLGREVVLGRIDREVPDARPGHVYHGLEVQSATAPKISTASLRVKSDILHWPEVNGAFRRKKFPGAPGGLYCGFVILFDTNTGAPVALMPDGLIQRMRVGATSALGSKYLSAPEARTVGIIGAGFQAETQIRTLLPVRDIQEIRIFSPTPQSRESLAERMSAEFDVTFVPVSSASEAAKGAQIIHAATNSRGPVISADDLEPGAHISVIGVQEIGEDVLRRAAVLASTRSHSVKLSHTAFADGFAEDVHEDEFRGGWWHNDSYWSRSADLGALINGRMTGRSTPEDITVFVNKGAALQFSAVGNALVKAATAVGVGQQFPTEWFLQPYTP